MTFDLAQRIGVLDRTPGTLHTMLHELDTAWLDATEGPDTWSPCVIVGQLVHGERADWVTRARLILSESTSRRPPPYDRFAHFHESRGKSLSGLLPEFERVRVENLATLAAWAVDGHRSCAGRRASRIRHRHAPATVGDLGCARLGTYRANRPCDGETVAGRHRAVARLLAHRGPIE